MISEIHGKVVSVKPMGVVVLVGGIGYQVAVTNGSGFVVGEETILYTYLAVRETAMDLYGFKTDMERAMFEHLIKLPKIGPKTALQILSQADIAILHQAVRTNDATYLSKMSGIGKKSAEKIVAGLKDVLGDDVLSTDVEGRGGYDDVVETLITLGYSQRDALLAVQKIPDDITDMKARIKHALTYVG